MEATQIGPYELVRRLGRGGMAETFLARRRGPGGFVQECCLKRVLPEHAGDAQFRDQFLDEATIHGRLHHGNIVRVSDFGEQDGTYFLVMELVDGCDLADLLEHARGANGGLPAELAVLVAADLCQALAYAHDLEDAQGPLELVHRDLTPSNVLLTRAGEVKLSDFGIARAAQRRHRTQTGYTKGKFCYMSPEQIEARDDLDGRSDLFALGCVLYEMLAGARPFDAPSGNDLAVLPRILEGQFEPLRQRAPGVPEELAAVVHQLLKRERDERPPHATSVLESLAPLLPAVTARASLAQRVRDVCESRERAAAGPQELPTRPVDLDAATRRDFAGEPTQPAPSTGPGAAAPARRPSRTALGVLLGSLVVLALVVAGLLARPHDTPGPSERPPDAGESSRQAAASGPPGESAPATSLGVPIDPAADSPAVALPPEGSGPEPAAVAAPEELGEGADAPDEPLVEGEPRATADLRVVVVPYGTIWIDGKRRGRTRVRATLPAGRHRIGIGRGDVPTRTEEVLLGPGRRTLEYALEGGFD